MFKIGITTAVIVLPGIVVGPIAGVYVDKLNRKDLLVAANIFQAFIVSIIAILYSFNQLPFFLLLLLLFLLNAGGQFVRPAINATIPRIMEKQDLAAANGLFSISSSVNQIAGYGIGGLLVLVFGIAIPIYYDSLTFIIAAIAAGLIARSVLALPFSDSSNNNSKESFKTKFVEGLSYIKSNRLLVELIILAVALNFFGGGIQTLLAPYAKYTLNGNAGEYGALLVGFSIGTVVGSLIVGKINSRSYVGKLLFTGITSVGICIVLIGLNTSIPIAFGLMLVTGLALAVTNLPIQVLVQAKVPGHLLGRVFTSIGALVTIATPVAAIVTGKVASDISIGSTLVVYGSLMLLAIALGFLAFKDVREANY